MYRNLLIIPACLCASGALAQELILPGLSEPAPVPSPAPAIVLQAPETWREGQDVTIRVEARNPSVLSVSLYLTAERTAVGGKSRGTITEVLTPATPVGTSIEEPNAMFLKHTFKTPYYDAVRLRLFAKGFDATGAVVARAKMPVMFVPSFVPADLTEGVVVSKARQRLVAVKDGAVKAVYVVSTGRRHTDGGGPTPTMVSRIHNKMRVAHSNRYEVDMRYWNAITSDGRYGIHATWPSEYPRLGTPDSHGCVRLHYTDARDFYAIAPVGYPVIVTQ